MSRIMNEGGIFLGCKVFVIVDIDIIMDKF